MSQGSVSDSDDQSIPTPRKEGAYSLLMSENSDPRRLRERPIYERFTHLSLTLHISSHLPRVIGLRSEGTHRYGARTEEGALATYQYMAFR